MTSKGPTGFRERGKMMNNRIADHDPHSERTLEQWAGTDQAQSKRD